MLLIFLAIMVFHWAKARDAEMRRLEVENHKYVGIIEEKKTRIQELEDNQAKTPAQQPILYPFPGISPTPPVATIPRSG